MIRSPQLTGFQAKFRESCIRYPVLRIDSGQRSRLEEIRDNFTQRIAQAEREGWLGEAEGLRVGLAVAEGKLAQFDERARRAISINLGIPAYREIAGRTATLPSGAGSLVITLIAG